MTMPELAVSDKFILSERYIRVEAPADSVFAGFWCEVRQNLSNGDRRLLIEAMEEITAPGQAAIDESQAEVKAIQTEIKTTATPERLKEITQRLNELTDQMNVLTDQTDEAKWRLAAPYIRDWNANQGDPPEKIPPPQIGGFESMDAVTKDMANWITSQLLVAYRSGKGVLNRSTPPGGSGQPGGGPKLGNGKGKSARTPRSQTTSHGHSASAFQA